MSNIVERFDRVSLGGDGAYSKPTPISIGMINKHFGIVLPELLIEFGSTSKCYDSWFASIGDDHQSKNHIIRINNHWRRRKNAFALPRNLVIFNLGFDKDFDCFDLNIQDQSTGECAVRYWTPGETANTSNYYDCFLSYIEDSVSHWEAEMQKYSKRKARQSRAQ